MIRNISRKQFLLRMDDDSDNSFAYTFLERCDKENLWSDAMGIITNNKLVGGYVGEVAGAVFTVKLLHVFEDSRGKGQGDKLLTNAFWYGDPVIRDMSSFLLLFLMLIFRPGGIFGHKIEITQKLATERI